MEFALIMPVLLLVIAGIVDFGRAFFTQVELTNAAREGARAAIITTVTAQQVQDRAGASIQPPITGFSTTVTICAASGGGNASVTARAPFTWILLGPALNLVGSAGSLPSTLSSTAVMKCGG